MRLKPNFLLLVLAFSTVAPTWAQVPSAPGSSAAKAVLPEVLTREQAAGIVPTTVFFRGQTATTQGRNSSGIKLPDGRLILFALVDTAGYSSAIQQTYQAYLLTEVRLTIGNQTLPPGAYGFGFVEDNRMVVMDIGGNEILHTTTKRDSTLERPNPLQIRADPTTHDFRLYLGRSYVTLGPSTN
jgi:hypothetical protein